MVRRQPDTGCLKRLYEMEVKLWECKWSTVQSFLGSKETREWQSMINLGTYEKKKMRGKCKTTSSLPLFLFLCHIFSFTGHIFSFGSFEQDQEHEKQNSLQSTANAHITSILRAVSCVAIVVCLTLTLFEFWLYLVARVHDTEERIQGRTMKRIDPCSDPTLFGWSGLWRGFTLILNPSGFVPLIERS